MPDLDALLSRGTAAVPAVVAAYGTREGVRYLGAAGVRCRATDEPLRGDAIFRIASMTKAITSVAALQLVEAGRLGLDDPVHGVLPQFDDTRVLEGVDADGVMRWRQARGRVTLRQLLTHTAGFGYEFLNAKLKRAVAAGAVGSAFRPDDSVLSGPLVNDPGSAWEYGTNTDWVGRLVEVLSGQQLGDYCRTHIFEPLGMADTDFAVPEAKHGRVVTVHLRAADGGLTELPDTVPAPAPFHSGGGGLYATASDYLTFLRAILHGGALDGARILSEALVAEASRDQIAPLRLGVIEGVDANVFNDFPDCEGAGHGLFSVITPTALATGRSAGSLTWAGLYNSYFWIDAAQGVAGVYMAQILPFNDADAIALNRAFETAVYANERSR